jgi:peptidoglycan hydrolase CwlO-like protein
MKPLKIKQNDKLEIFSIKATKWIGSTSSLLVHTALFIASFLLYFYGINIEEILLVVTTIVSLEAIYLSIFIQMSVNRQARKLHAVARDVGEIQEDVEEIEKDVDEIQKDVDEIQEDVEEIEKDVDEIQKDVDEIQEDVEEIQEDEEIEIPKNDDAIFRIEETLKILIEEISELKNSKTKNKKE